MKLLDRIPFQLALEALMTQVHVEPGSEDAARLAHLLDLALAAARPKAVFKVGYVEARGTETVTINGVTFTSRVLRRNLDTIERVFFYIITCGRELDSVPVERGDFVQEFWRDAIKGNALAAAGAYLRDHLDRHYAVKKISSMAPGSGEIETWPIEQQRLLFSMFGDTERLMGVRLTDSFLMVPNKTVSGLFFPTQVDFVTCRLCSREKCAGRRAAYDRDFAQTYSIG